MASGFLHSHLLQVSHLTLSASKSLLRWHKCFWTSPDQQKYLEQFHRIQGADLRSFFSCQPMPCLHFSYCLFRNLVWLAAAQALRLLSPYLSAPRGFAKTPQDPCIWHLYMGSRVFVTTATTWEMSLSLFYRQNPEAKMGK